MSSERLPPWRRGLLTAVLLVALLLLATQFSHYPIKRWLLWRYVRYWAWCGAFTLGCYGTGEVIMRWLDVRLRGLHLRLFTSLCLGCFSFGMLMFACGLLRLYSAALFWTLPLAMMVFGARRLRAAAAVLARVRRLAPLRFPDLLSVLIILFGLFGFALVYAGVVTPENAMFDSRWKHMALAETYAAHGGVMRFPQGWMFSTRPHFASLLYTWGFLIPGDEIFDHMVMCAHLELTLFLWTTLLGIPALVRWLVPTASPSLVWAARFLFPGMFLHDANLSVGADHIAATFAIPVMLVSYKLIRRRFHLGTCALLGMLLAALVMIKETACLILLPLPVLMVAVSMVRQAVRPQPGDARLRWLLGPLLISIMAIACSAPMWLTNLVWHGDPLYPNLHAYLDVRPWSPDATYMFEWGYKDFQFGEWSPYAEDGRLLGTLKVLFTWSFIPHDWEIYHGDRPVIGSLVTLLLPALLLLRGTRRIWLLALWIHVGLVVWFNVLPQDRYLQAIMPLMAGFVAAVMTLVWRARARVALALLVGAQIVWGGDVFFLYRNPLKHVAELFKAGHSGRYQGRLRTQGSWYDVGKAMPKGARMLVHEVHPHIGSNVVTIPDFQTWQFGLSYSLMSSPRDVWEALRDMDITHVLWRGTRSRSWDSVAGDLLFFTFVRRYTLDAKGHGKKKYMVGRMPDEPPPGADEFESTVLVIGCDDRGYGPGLYELTDLNVPTFGPKSEQFPAPRVTPTATEGLAELAKQAEFVVVDPECKNSIYTRVRRDFALYAKREVSFRVENIGYQLWARKPPEAATVVELK